MNKIAKSMALSSRGCSFFEHEFQHKPLHICFQSGHVGGRWLFFGPPNSARSTNIRHVQLKQERMRIAS